MGHTCQEKFKNWGSYTEKLYLFGNMHYEHDGLIVIDAKAEQSLINYN